MFWFKKKKIFISYSHSDTAIIKTIVEELKESSIIVIFDEEFKKAGKLVVDTIRNEIERCDVFILAISKESIDSDWVGKEFNFATALRKEIIPVLVKDVQKNDMPDDLKNKIYVDLSKDIATGLEKLNAQLIFRPPFWKSFFRRSISLSRMLILLLIFFQSVTLISFYIREHFDMRDIKNQQMKIQVLDNLINSRELRYREEPYENGLIRMHYDKNNSLIGKDDYSMNEDKISYTLKYRIFYSKNKMTAKDSFVVDKLGAKYKERVHFDQKELAFIREEFTETGQLHKKMFDKDRNGNFVEKSEEFTSKFPPYFLLPFKR